MAQTKIRKEQLVTGRFLIEDINAIGGNQTSFDFQNIPSTFKTLELELSLRAGNVGVSNTIDVRFNNDSGSNYDCIIGRLHTPDTLETFESIAASIPSIGYCPGLNAVSGDYSDGLLRLNNYASANINKNGSYTGSSRYSATSGSIEAMQGYVHWRSTAAINRITVLTPNSATYWVQYSRVTLYGIN